MLLLSLLRSLLLLLTLLRADISRNNFTIMVNSLDTAVGVVLDSLKAKVLNPCT